MRFHNTSQGKYSEVNHLGWRIHVQDDQVWEGSLENEGRESKTKTQNKWIRNKVEKI